MAIATEYEELAIRLKNSPDIYPIVEMLKSRDKTMFNKGYQACANDRKLSRIAAAKARMKSLLDELEIIDDVIASPYDFDTT